MSLLHSVSQKLIPFKGDRFLLALSGGLDSIALLQVFLHAREHLKVDFSVAHFFHGESSDPIQQDYRYNTMSFVEHQCRIRDVPWYCNSPEPVLQSDALEGVSEASYRERRYAYLWQILEKENIDHLVTAHHRDDLLETRLIRLIRGTGPQGLESMSFQAPRLLRPLLETSRKELKTHLVENNCAWVEDPSNQSSQPLRNWLRKKWLPELEEKYPGGVQSLARSLDLLVTQIHSHDLDPALEACLMEGALCLAPYWALNETHKRLVVANYMKSQGLKNYGLSHINEVCKRLDTEKKRHTFSLLGRRWNVDAGRMSVEPSA